MSRPLRIEFPGAVYHVTSRGDRREPIYKDDEDRHTQLDSADAPPDSEFLPEARRLMRRNNFRLVVAVA
jgi:hypothetical protein